MAVTLVLPVFRAAGAQSAGTTGATAVAAPAGVATGDLEILVAEVRAADTCSITTDGGSAWSAMAGSPVSVAAGEKLYVWSRVRQAGDSNPSVTPSADHVDACRLAYQAGTFDPQDPFENEVTGTEAAVDTSFSFAPGGSTAGNNRLVLVISTILRDSNVASVPICTNAALSNLASRANFCTNSGAGGGFGITEGRLATAAAVGTFACTYAATSAKAYISFAIKPFSTATGTAAASNTTPRVTGGVGIRGFISPASTVSNSTPRATASGAKGSYPPISATRVRASDGFDDGIVDPFLWSAALTVTESGGRGNIPFVNGVTRSFRSDLIYVSPKDTDLTVEVVRGNSDAAGNTLTVELTDSLGNNRIGWSLTNTGIFAPLLKEGGVSNDGGSLVYNSTTHRWWRVRESRGVFFWETSPDGSVWTVRRTVVRTATWNLSMRVDLRTSGSASPPADALVDNWSINEYPAASAAAAAAAAGAGAKAVSGTASASAKTTVTASGAATAASASGSATATNAAPRATATGAKGGTSAATGSAAPRATGTGAKDDSGAATASSAPRATATGQKDVSGSAAASGAARATVSSSKGAQDAASASAAARATCSGAEGGVSVSPASAKPRVTAEGAKSGQGAAAASASATATASGQENSSGSATATAAPRAVASGQKGGQSAAACSLSTAIAGTGAKADSGAAAASAAPRVTAAGGRVVTGTASVSAATRVVVSGTAEPFRHEDAVISAAPRAAASGSKATSGAASASAAPRTSAAGAKAVSGASTATAAAHATGSGATDRTAAATVSVGARVTTAESRQGSATISVGVTVTTGEAHSGSAAVSAAATCTAAGVVSTTVVEDGWDSHAELEAGRFRIQGPGDHLKIAYPRVGSVD